VLTSLELECAAIPETVTSARSAITALCERLQLEDEVITRVRIAVNEACINCVQHAYTGERPDTTYMLEARVEQDALIVVVHDYGIGSPDTGQNAGVRFGLRMIEELTDGTHFSSRPGHGTRVAMRFAIPS
jgi:anti-sigma regulatory factor (Ser/Thr protein kinase)